jgi:hypothetical protein
MAFSMNLLETVYASAPSDQVIVHTLEISHPAIDTVYVCGGFDDIRATTEGGTEVDFIAGAIDVSLPARDSTGQQHLMFAIDNVMGTVQQTIDAIINAGGQATLTYRQYLHSDLSQPADPPLVMTIVSGSLKGGTAQIRASYYDILNTAWPRKRYTNEFAPGLKYL